MSESVKRTVGLDIHPDVFTAAILAGQDAGSARIVTVSPSLPLHELRSWVERHTQPSDQLVLEASGNSFEIVRQLAAAGRNAQVLESRRVGQVGKAYCAHDKGDAIKIARVWLSGLAQVVWVPDEATQLRRELLARYRRAVTDQTRCRNRLRSYLSDHGVRLPVGTSLTRPATRTHLLGLRPWAEAQHELLQCLLEDLLYHHTRREQLRARIAREVSTDPQMRSLVRLFGIREILAFTLVAIIGDIRRFRTPRQLVAYIGLNPRVAESGTSGGNGPLAHNGRKDLRSMLVEAAHALLRHNNPLHLWGRRLAARRNHNVAVAAVARKMLVAVWYLLQGRFSPLLEIDPTLRVKISKIAVCIGRANIKQMGFPSSKAFQEHLLNELLQSTS